MFIYNNRKGEFVHVSIVRVTIGINKKAAKFLHCFILSERTTDISCQTNQQTPMYYIGNINGDAIGDGNIVHGR
jgi:hypothetical protein